MRTKSGQYDDTVFFNDRVSRLSGRSFVAGMICRKKKLNRPLVKSWSLSLGTLDRWFSEATTARSLRSQRLTPHCARHGAASSDSALGLRSLDEIQRKGRWLASTSVRRYEKAGRLNRQVCLMTSAQLALAKKARSRVIALCS